MKNGLLYILKRLSMMLVVLFTVITITFVLLELKPGGPLSGIQFRTEAQKEIAIEKYGLNDPPVERYVTFWKGLLTEGNLGYSVKRQRDINEIIATAVPVSMRIGIIPVVLGTIIGVTMGVIAAINRNGILDFGTTFLVVLGVSVPGFVVAQLLQYYFAGELGWFPTMYGSSKYPEYTWYVLPTIALIFGVFASYARFARTEMVENLHSDYIMLARAKGASEFRVVVNHAVRNILIPIVTILPFTFMVTITGALAVEAVFNIPGMGGLLVEAIQANDYPLILGVCFFFTVLVLVAYLVVDFLIVLVDPRIRLEGN